MPYAVLAVLAYTCLVAYLYGESVARIAVALTMAFCSFAILGLVYVAVIDVNRQIYAKPNAAVRYGAPR